MKATQATLVSYKDQVQRYQKGGYKALKKLYKRLPKAVKQGDE